MKSITYGEFIDSVVEDAVADGVSKKEAVSIARGVFEKLSQDVKAGNRVAVPRLGVFEPEHHEGREGVVNFGAAKGKTYKTAGYNAIHFKPSKSQRF